MDKVGCIYCEFQKWWLSFVSFSRAFAEEIKIPLSLTFPFWDELYVIVKLRINPFSWQNVWKLVLLNSLPLSDLINLTVILNILYMLLGQILNLSNMSVLFSENITHAKREKSTRMDKKYLLLLIEGVIGPTKSKWIRSNIWLILFIESLYRFFFHFELMQMEHLLFLMLMLFNLSLIFEIS